MSEQPKPEPDVATAETMTSGGSAFAPVRGTPNIGGERAGHRLAHFRIERPLGKGGMGEVYLATDVALERPVALKILPREVSRDSQLRERFYREARAQARIQHPNVCHIYYIGEEDDLLFFAMEYIDGESLQERIARVERLAPEVAVDLCRQAALGLREANRHGFTHRDVKPSNLMVDANGVVKVVDFGIVKQQVDPASPSAEVAALTGTSGTTLIGTPLYMAPEQARGERVDFRADIYSLGATLHHLCAGAPPFAGDTAMAIVSKHLADRRPRLPATKRAGRAATNSVDALCERMMAKRPDARFASYDELLIAMEQASPAYARPAGFWVRSFAVALDVLAVTMLALVVKLIYGLFVSHIAANVGDVSVLVVAVPYTILLHARWGRTLGKLALEIEVVPADRAGRVGWRAAAKRFLAELGPSYLAIVVGTMLDLVQVSRVVDVVSTIVLLVVGIGWPIGFGIAASLNAQRRTIWDRASRTRVRYRRAGAA